MGSDPIWWMSLREEIWTPTDTKGRPWEDTGEGAFCHPRRDFSGDTRPAKPLTLDFQSLEWWDNNFLWLKSFIWGILYMDVLTQSPKPALLEPQFQGPKGNNVTRTLALVKTYFEKKHVLEWKVTARPFFSYGRSAKMSMGSTPGWEWRRFS